MIEKSETENKEQSLRSKLKEQALQLCNQTSMHGLAYIVNNENFFYKLIWIIIVIIGIIACIICIWQKNEKFSKKAINIL
jgi:hypothetical protein